MKDGGSSQFISYYNSCDFHDNFIRVGVTIDIYQNQPKNNRIIKLLTDVQ